MHSFQFYTYETQFPILILCVLATCDFDNNQYKYRHLQNMCYNTRLAIWVIKQLIYKEL